MPVPVEESIAFWDFIRLYGPVIAAILAIGVAWGRMEMGVSNLKKEQDDLKGDVDEKMDLKSCETTHFMLRENQDIVVKTIESGHKAIRKDIANLTQRLDSHIAANGRKGP